MITGIDEVGDFNPDSAEFNYFLAVHIDQNQNKYLIKQSQFHIWEGTIPTALKTQKGEVKGQQLNDAQLESFFKEVISPAPKCLYSLVRIRPNENPAKILDKHKQFEITQIEQIVQKAERAGHTRWAKGYLEILKWYKNRNYQELMKVKCLEHLLSISFSEVLVYAQLTYLLDKRDTSNLQNIQFKIDRDFIRADNVKVLWGEILRQFFMEFSKSNKIPILSEWPDEKNPVLDFFRMENNQIKFKKVFREGTNFLNSEDHFEIRMADILGTIVHRFQNRNRCSAIYKPIEESFAKRKNSYLHLILNDI